MAGCNGVIVNKRTGKLFHLGSAFPAERDLDLYDRGYQFECYDLVILSVPDREQTLSSLAKLRFTVVEPEEAHGVVWKIPRAITKAELARKLDQLPCTMAAVNLYFVAEVLEAARVRDGSRSRFESTCRLRRTPQHREVKVLAVLGALDLGAGPYR